MRFNTHNRTPKIVTNKTLKIMFALCYGLVATFFLFMAIVYSISIHNILPAVLMLGPLIVTTVVVLFALKDMDRAYVEISDQVITVVDYCFGVEQKKVFFMQEIAAAEILVGSSMGVRGYRYSNVGCAYIVFRDHNGKYMFKILCSPETQQYFGKFLIQ